MEIFKFISDELGFFQRAGQIWRTIAVEIGVALLVFFF